MSLQVLSSAEPRDTTPIVGIDLGTTNSLIAFVKNGLPEVLKSREGRALIPSVVAIDEQGKPVVGYEAKHHKVRKATNTVFSVKRLLGRGFADLQGIADTLPYKVIPGDGILKIQVGEHAYTAIEISAMILRELKLAAEASLETAVTRAVITVPAYFNDSQRQATRTAGRLAGLDVLRIINEPTAASLAYGLDRKREGLIAVYDLGGGTFDVSILKLHNGIFEVLSTNGNTTLGGDDLDQAIVNVAVADIKALWNVDARADVQLNASLIEAAEAVKIALSTEKKSKFEVQVTTEQGDKKYTREWTREEFENKIRPVLEQTRQSCVQALKDAGLQASDLSDVVLVGGPTRLGVVQQIAREIFGREPNTSMHPDEVVALGAAIQADILAGNNKDLLLLDIVPLTLGLETYGGLMAPIIHRNTKIPTVAREAFTTFVENQTAVDIHILQGERERVEDNRSLARFKLKGIQPMPAGIPRVEVTFLVDADGILQVAAKDVHTGNEQSIEVRPTYGLTDAQVESMLQSSYDHAQEDMNFTRLVDARNKAEPVLRSVEKKLTDARRLLPETDVQTIEDRMKGLRFALDAGDADQIAFASQKLNQSTLRLAELLVKEAIQRAADAQKKS